MNFVNCVRFSPDGSKFITVGSDKKGLIYDAKTGEKIGELSSEDGHKGSIYAVSWSSDSKQVWPRINSCGMIDSADTVNLFVCLSFLTLPTSLRSPPFPIPNKK